MKLKQAPLTERINGLNLSASGYAYRCMTNGLYAGSFGQIPSLVIGISTSLPMNFIKKHKGMMTAMFNDAYNMSGLQFGLSNNSNHTKGLQIAFLTNNADEIKGLQLGLYNKS